MIVQGMSCSNYSLLPLAMCCLWFQEWVKYCAVSHSYIHTRQYKVLGAIALTTVQYRCNTQYGIRYATYCMIYGKYSENFVQRILINTVLREIRNSPNAFISLPFDIWYHLISCGSKPCVLSARQTVDDGDWVDCNTNWRKNRWRWISIRSQN